MDEKGVALETGGWLDVVNREILILASISMMGGATLMGIQDVLQMHYRDLGYPASIYGKFLMLMGMSNVLSRYLSGRTSRRCESVAIAGFLLTAVGVLLLTLLYPADTCWMPALVMGFGMGFTTPTIQFMVISLAPRPVRNRTASVYSMGFDLGGFLGPVAYSVIAEFAGYKFSYLLLTVPSVIAVLLLTAVGRGATGDE